jgi:preprotein translocase subunit SecG
MLILLTLVHVIVCVFLIIVVLLQSGKAADLAGAFGGMGSQTAFGPRGSATLLSKATTVSAVVFMFTSLTLSILATRSSGAGSTVLERQSPAPAKGAPARTAPSQSTPAPARPSVSGGTQTQEIPLTIPPVEGKGPTPNNPAKQPAPAQKK